MTSSGAHSIVPQKASTSFDSAVDSICLYFEETDEAISSKFQQAKRMADAYEVAFIARVNSLRLSLIKPSTHLEGEAYVFLRMYSNSVNSFEATGSTSTAHRLKASSFNIRRHPQITSILGFCRQLSLDVKLLNTFEFVIVEPARVIPAWVSDSDVKEDASILAEKCIYPGLERIKRPVCDIKEPIQRVGSYGKGTAQFMSPEGIAIHPRTNLVYVADYNNNRVQILTADLIFHSTLDLKRPKKSECRVTGVAISPKGDRIVAVCKTKPMISIWDENHTLLIDITNNPPESILGKPNYVTFDCTGMFYVTDEDRSCVLKYSRDGVLIATFLGPTPNIPISLARVQGITINDRNELLVAGTSSNQIHILTTSGVYLRSLSIKISGEVYLGRGPNGGFIISDYGDDTTTFYDHEGIQLKVIKISSPVGVAYNSKEQFYLVNRSKDYIEIY